jgi:hypothetical protein
LPKTRQLSKPCCGSKDELLRVAQEFGLEGLVAKRPNSLYESGCRSGAWVKFKITKSQEFVIGGYTLPEGTRKYFDSLLVGYQSSDALLFAGRVGTGFFEKLLASIDAQLQKLRRATCPFINLPEKKTKAGGAWGLLRRSCNAATGSNPSGLPRSNLPSGHTTTNSVNQSCWDCELIKRRKMSFATRTNAVTLRRRKIYPSSDTGY